MLVLTLLLATSLQMPVAPADAWRGVVTAFGPFRPRLGAWAEYLVQSRGEQDVRVRFAVVEPPPDGRRAWIEVATVGSRSVPVAARLLLDTASGKLERASIYALGQSPIELPLDSDDAADATARPTQTSARHTTKVIVPAGRFDATELRVRNGGQVTRAWRAEQVPLWGIVRVRQRARRIELLRFGHSGARSVFPRQGNGSDSAKE